jgi:hypothetical protein
VVDFYAQELLKRVIRKSKYDVSEVQFSSARDTLVAVASNDKVNNFPKLPDTSHYR